MKKTYFEAPALELVKVQSMLMTSQSTIESEDGEGAEAGSRGFSGFGLEDDTEEEE